MSAAIPQNRGGVYWHHFEPMAQSGVKKGSYIMGGRKTVDTVIAEAERLVQVWGENAKFSMGDLTLEGLRTEITKLRNLRQSRDEARTSLTKLIDNTNDQMKVLEGFNTRGRSGMKAIFGPDSTQYAQVGGKRQSERKPKSSKKTAKTAI